MKKFLPTSTTLSVNKTKGFTLIELLVVIAIIGLLSAIGLASFSMARSKGRDAQRIANAKQVQTALEMYYNANGSYISSYDVMVETALTPLVPKYIPKLPTGGSYWYYNAGQASPQWYAIYVKQETRDSCYVCSGDNCRADLGYWSVNICE